MSIYKDCSRACRELAATGKAFIDIDVVNAAADPGWAAKHFREAQRHANQIVGTEYRAGKLVRYGPVKYENEDDYVRRAGRVLYADAAEGPQEIETPNGKFGPIHDRDDKLARVGRRRGTKRDDFTSWDAQTAEAVVGDGMLVDGRPLMRRINTLEANLKQANKRNEELVAEVERLRKGLANGSNGSDVVSHEMLRSMVDDRVIEITGALEARLADLEKQEERRAKLYA